MQSRDFKAGETHCAIAITFNVMHRFPDIKKPARWRAGKILLTSGIKSPSSEQIYHRFGKNQQHYRVTLFNCRSAHDSSMSNRTTSVS